MFWNKWVYIGNVHQCYEVLTVSIFNNLLQAFMPLNIEHLSWRRRTQSSGHDIHIYTCMHAYVYMYARIWLHVYMHMYIWYCDISTRTHHHQLNWVVFHFVCNFYCNTLSKVTFKLEHHSSSSGEIYESIRKLHMKREFLG